MAVQPFTQAIWGRPKLRLSFEDFNGHLFCMLQNVPIRERFLKILCVTRMPVQDLSVEISIYGEDRVLPIYADIVGRILQFSDSSARHITLPASITCASFNVAAMNKNMRMAICVDEGNFIKPTKKYLGVGRYRVRVIISADGRQIFKYKDFEIQELPYPYWIKDKDEL